MMPLDRTGEAQVPLVAAEGVSSGQRFGDLCTLGGEQERDQESVRVCDIRRTVSRKSS